MVVDINFTLQRHLAAKTTSSLFLKQFNSWMVRDGPEASDQLEINIRLLIGDVRFDSWRHQVAKTTSGLV
jgi:hypothetical protein